MELVIKKFKVKGFLGRYILEMDFEHNVKVIVAENGFGKTTLLNMLCYTISGDKKELDKLKQYNLANDKLTKAEYLSEIMINYINTFDFGRGEIVPCNALKANSMM